ncbi:glycosyltransferase family 2 protein [Anaeromassilibacillus senegalensis]|uniref:Glycosyltransferase family 2 protein n=1 Tax=Anaeromassilibacillus senegalensis TaxID=1673717 RepID=A0ABS9CPW7_9FIRM|nr:glycosyltransferase family 2 protein [Anaeromassilibacillus senegalensis]MCF2653180.1 glycosyltransferase family 2 protein [Anaeromassilibacillus senegalensis]
MIEEMVSVIIPVYNIEVYLRECVESVLAQTYENFELILVDDGSKDNSPAICDEFAQLDSRVVVIHKENEGPSATRNRGIEAAQGEFIVFVDSDDRIHPQMLEKMTAAMTRYQTDLCICGFERFRDGWKQRVRISPYSLLIFQSKQELASVYKKANTNMFGVSIWAKMYRAQIIKDNNIRFSEDIDYEEDCCFNIDYFQYVTTTSVLRDYFYFYRQMEQSLSKGYRKDTYKFLVNGYRRRKEFMENLGMATGGVDAIFLIVIKTTLMKIFVADLSKEEKFREYKEVIDFEESRMVSEQAVRSKVRLTRMLSKAIVAESPKRIHNVLEIWKVVHGFKSFLKKIKRNCKNVFWRLKR